MTGRSRRSSRSSKWWAVPALSPCAVAAPAHRPDHLDKFSEIDAFQTSKFRILRNSTYLNPEHATRPKSHGKTQAKTQTTHRTNILATPTYAKRAPKIGRLHRPPNIPNFLSARVRPCAPAGEKVEKGPQNALSNFQKRRPKGRSKSRMRSNSREQKQGPA